MRKALLPALAFISLCACRNSDIHFKVLIGATAVVAPGAQPINDSVIVIAGTRIRSVGMRKDVPVPQNSDRTDLTGKWIVPAEGTVIGPEEIANLLVLDHAPAGTAPSNPADVGARIAAGEWKSAH
jgi:hypothetical protein